jgi:hypothetical protein
VNSITPNPHVSSIFDGTCGLTQHARQFADAGQAALRAGNVPSGEAALTFTLYEDQQGGAVV